MIVLYVSLLLLLLVVKFLVDRRVGLLERKYTHIARQTDELLRGQSVKPGNSGRPDPYVVARQAYLLGQAVEKREKVEGKYVAWQKLADRFGTLLTTLRNWKGRKLPYAVGVLDVMLGFVALEYLGYRDQLSTQTLVEYINTLIHKV